MIRATLLLKLLFGLCLLALAPSEVHAQATVAPLCYNPSGSQATNNLWVPCTVSNPLQVSGSFSASGFPTVQTTGTPISVTTGGVTGTLPSGAVVVATNVGTTNAAYCKLGASATTSDQYVAPNGGWFAFTVGAATQLTCITSTSTTTVNMVGGSGLPTGTGGGSGGSGGLSVVDGATFTASSSSFTPSGGEYASSPTTCADGKQCTVAMTTNRAFTIDTPTTGNNLYAAMTAAIPVNVSAVPTAVTGHTVSGNTGVDMNIQMMGGAALGTAGSANSSVITVQGIASMTPILTTSTPSASSGCTPMHGINGGTTSSTNSTVLHNAASTACHLVAINTSASTIGYLKVYDSSSAPTCSSATGLKHVYPILANGGYQALPVAGESYASGIAFCFTGGGTDTDNSNGVAGVYIEGSYK